MIEQAMIDAVVGGWSRDPFGVLGLHDGVVRCFLPGARGVELVSGEAAQPMRLVDPAGLFAGDLPAGGAYRLRIDWQGTIQETADPYSFGPLLGELDLYLLAEGRHRDIASCLGAHVMEVGGVPGVRFAVWAPNAARV